MIKATHKLHSVFLITLIVSFCSIVYELILAQSLSILLGNTVVRYSITIGMYIFSLGMGALYVGYKKFEHPIKTLVKIEIYLSLLGIALPILLFFGDYILRLLFYNFENPSTSLNFILSNCFLHVMILVIGFLSGIELPLLMQLCQKEEDSQKVLAIDYFGTFLGAVAFPLFLYEYLGLIAGSAIIGGLNALAALMLLSLEDNKKKLMVFFNASTLIVSACIIFINEKTITDKIVTLIFG